MHHKRRRPRNARAGCHMCKPWKGYPSRKNRADSEKFSDYKRRKVADEAVNAG